VASSGEDSGVDANGSLSEAGVNGVGPRRFLRNRQKAPRNSAVGPFLGLDYPSTAEANAATAPQIAIHRPSDNSALAISAAPGFSVKVAACADRSDWDSLALSRRLRRPA
jgi:hypothetical protein